MMDNKARIYASEKSAMQRSGGRTKQWVLEFISLEPLYREPTMNWTGMRDTQPQVRLYFLSQTEACLYAQSHNLRYEIIPCHSPTLKLKSYARNFS